mmetsp:Transcript_22588/g.49033  ORF Transcript_22588/g.49033 Transcript_22588/m.49033 type:complete len:389 (-) Transcript_22588:136-1302(-)
MQLARKESERLMRATGIPIKTNETSIKAKGGVIRNKKTLSKEKDVKISSQRQALKAKDRLLHMLTNPRKALAAAVSSRPRNGKATRGKADSVDRVANPSRKQKTTGETSSTGPHEVLVIDEIASLTLSFTGLAEFASGARTCRTWSRAAKSVDNNAYFWLGIVRSRWPAEARYLESEVGPAHFKSACKEKLRDEDHHRIVMWKRQTIPSSRTAEYWTYNSNAYLHRVPEISWLYHKGHIRGSAVALSVLSHNWRCPAPIFKRYEAPARAMYDDRCNNGGIVSSLSRRIRTKLSRLSFGPGNTRNRFKDLPPVPSNLSDWRRRDHERARRIIKGIFFNPDGSLMDKMPDFGYRNEVALYFAGTCERNSPAEVVAGIRFLESYQEPFGVV